MKNIKWIILSLLFVVVGCKTVQKVPLEVVEQKDHEEWRYDVPVGEVTPVAPEFPNVSVLTLKNGFKIYAVKDSRLPIVQTILTFKNGSSTDLKPLQGANYLVTQMLTEGAGPYSALALDEEFADLGTEVSSSSSKDYTIISAGALSDKLDRIVELFALMAQKPTFLASDFTRIKSNHLNGLAAKQAVPSYVAQEGFLKMVYGPDHPYGRPTMGSNETVNRITLKDVKTAYTNYFGANNAALIIVGDVEIDHVKQLAEKHFGSWRHKAKTLPVIKAPRASGIKTLLIERPKTPQSFILVGGAKATYLDPHLPAYELIQEIVAGSPSSRLGANLREAKGWTYGVQVAALPLRGPGPMMLSSSIQVPYGADAIQEILKEFDNMKSEVVADKEFNDAQKGALASYSERFNTVGSVAANLVNMFVYNLPTTYLKDFYGRLAQLTKADLLEASKALFDEKSLAIVGVGDLDVLEIPLSKNTNVGKITIEKDKTPAPSAP